MKLYASLAAVFLIACPIATAEYKVATVEINRVLNDSKEAQVKRKELEQKTTDARKKIEEKSRTLKAMEDKLKESSASESSKEAQKFRSDSRELDRMVKDTEEELRGEFMKFNKALAERAMKLVADYAKTNQIDLVLDKSDRTRSAVLFGKPELDITDEIIRRMNQ